MRVRVRGEGEGVSYLGLGHVQQAYRVAVTVEEGADGVEGLCGTVSRCPSAPQTPCWPTTAAPGVE